MNDEVTFSKDSLDEFVEWYEKDKKTARRIYRMIKEIVRDKDSRGIGKAQLLKYNLSGCNSKRIDDTNRIVYRIKNDHVEILSLKKHYDDK